MGANAQTTVPTFTAGQVLTAAQMNDSARTGVPVFATTGTRDAGFGGSGEKTLAEGQMCYVEGTGFQTYDGTSWVTWGTAPADSGLTLVSTQTIGSAVATVAVTSVFSSTYDNYLVIVSGGAGSADAGLGIQMGATTTGYYWGALRQTYSGSGNNVNGDNTASWSQIGRMGTDGLHLCAQIISPNLAKSTFYSAGVASNYTSASGIMGISCGFVNNTTQYTGFTLTTTSGTITGGTIKVYGYKN